jgi:hypothetical protein
MRSSLNGRRGDTPVTRPLILDQHIKFQKENPSLAAAKPGLLVDHRSD